MPYYKVRMLYKDNYNKSYNVYVLAFDKKEAKQIARNELLEDEKDDVIDAVQEISQIEYIKGCDAFGNGIR